MPSFKHQSIERSGSTTVGVLVAPDRASALRMLQARGLVPIALDQSEDESDARGTAAARASNRLERTSSKAADPMQALRAMLARRNERPSLKRTELANLVRELATAIEAGLPLLNALKIARKQSSGKAQPVIMDFLIEYVEAGRPLHEAMEEYGPPFDEMIVGMVRAADASGRAAEVLHQLADLLDRSVELRRELVGATVYPMIVAFFIAVSIIILVTILLPRLMAPLLGQPGVTLPLPTVILMSFADFMRDWWWAVLLLGTAIVIGFRRWVAKPVNRRTVDLWLLKTPILGDLLRDVAVARFTRTLGTLVSAGLPILQALRIVRDTLGNTVLMDAVDGVQEKVTTGQSLAEPLERC
ncbi:MAG: type II secretion system F family protein, partial [Phycisphaerae bacterium]|nr:type II secretion system F family protein [Phycisphaerae bacterium]